MIAALLIGFLLGFIFGWISITIYRTGKHSE